MAVCHLVLDWANPEYGWIGSLICLEIRGGLPRSGGLYLDSLSPVVGCLGGTDSVSSRPYFIPAPFGSGVLGSLGSWRGGFGVFCFGCLP